MEKDTFITFLDGMLYAAEGKNPAKAIENQEKRGQQTVVQAKRLPKKMNDLAVPSSIKWVGVEDSMEYEERFKIINRNNIEYTKQQYEKMGISIIGEADDLFWNVTLPEGWEIKATDHCMWNDLLDNKGRERATFFYKAAFYDRDAFINFSTRYHVLVTHTADPDADYDVWKASDYQGTVKDGEEVIFSTECVPTTNDYVADKAITDKLDAQLTDYMNQHYPDYQDINAYWD